MSEYFKGRGKVYQAVRNFSSQTDDGFMAVANSFSWLGNVSEFSLEPSSTRETVINFWDGTDGKDLSLLSDLSMKVTMMAEEASFENMNLALLGGRRIIQGETVTGALFAVRNLTTKRWIEQDGTTALPLGRAVRVARSISPDHLFIDSYTMFDPASVVVRDSSTPRKTLQLRTHYTVNTGNGNFTFTAFPAGVTFPLRADFDANLSIDTIDGPVDRDRPYALTRQNLETLVIRDSANPRATLDPALYDADLLAGMVTFKAGVNQLGLDWPLQVTSTYGAVEQLTLMEQPSVERWLRFVGINLVDGRNIMADIYRFSLDPAKLSLITKDSSKLTFTGEALTDPSMPADGPMGRLGRIMRYR